MANPDDPRPSDTPGTSRYRRHSFEDPNDITVESLKPGVLNPYHAYPPSTVEYDHQRPVASAVLAQAEDQHDAKRWRGQTKFRGWIVKNLTPPSKGAPIKNEHRDATPDTDYRMGSSRGLVLVYCPELHGCLTSMKTGDPSKLPANIESLYDFTTKVFGDWEYMSKLKVKMFVNFELMNASDRQYATLTMPDDGTPPENSLSEESEDEKNKKHPRQAAKSGKSRQVNPDSRLSRRFQGDVAAALGVLNDPLAREMLTDPFPEERPSAKSKNVYHSTVDKELLKGPSPVGYIDWTGAGGGGMCSQGFGKPAQGRLVYYQTLRDRDERGPMLVPLPTQYTTKSRRMHVHRAALEPYLALLAQARQDGIPDPIFRAYSTHRTIEEQRASFEYWLNTKYGGNPKLHKHHPDNKEAYRKCRVYNGDPDDPIKIRRGQAPGGDHLCGRGIDMFLGFNQNDWVNRWQRDQKRRGRPGGRSAGMRAFKTFMHNTKSWKWLEINAEFFGFYNYVKEPWHWAFNPDDRPKRQDQPPSFPAPEGSGSPPSSPGMGSADRNLDEYGTENDAPDPSSSKASRDLDTYEDDAPADFENW